VPLVLVIIVLLVCLDEMENFPRVRTGMVWGVINQYVSVFKVGYYFTSIDHCFLPFGNDSEDEEKVVAMLAKNFGRLMRNEWFKKKFSEKINKAPKESEPEEAKKKDPRGPRSFKCLGFGHIRTNCENLKQGKGKAYNATLSNESE